MAMNPSLGVPSAEATQDRIDSAADQMHAGVDKLAESVAPAVERVRSTAERLQDKVMLLGDMEREWADSTRGVVREHPLASVAVALAAGIVISRLVR
ncbi:MAG: hypothetical protein JWQ11_2955 [Rhizobacter sp.]|nr:hypothetical protein [Rhizobacter sp.]